MTSNTVIVQQTFLADYLVQLAHLMSDLEAGVGNSEWPVHMNLTGKFGILRRNHWLDGGARHSMHLFNRTRAVDLARKIRYRHEKKKNCDNDPRDLVQFRVMFDDRQSRLLMSNLAFMNLSHWISGVRQ
jgi:hypothetical protein